jgi:hypothetical protein
VNLASRDRRDPVTCLLTADVGLDADRFRVFATTARKRQPHDYRIDSWLVRSGKGAVREEREISALGFPRFDSQVWDPGLDKVIEPSKDLLHLLMDFQPNRILRIGLRLKDREPIQVLLAGQRGVSASI